MSSSGQSVKAPEGNRTLTHDPRKLRRRRLEAGLTIRQLGELAHVGKSSISDLENGRQSARINTLAALAPHLGCPVADLLAPEQPVVAA